MQKVKLFSIDIGTTTCCSVLFEAQIEANCLTGKIQLHNAKVLFQSRIEFTPLIAEELDESALVALVNSWLNEANINANEIFAGGVIITGISARTSNATRVAQSLQLLLKNTLIHTVGDPNLEAWLAFKGCIDKSNSDLILNFDIGGGTTNVALGSNGQVLATSCYDIGARHFQFKPGTYCLKALSQVGQHILDHLELPIVIGDLIPLADIQKIAQLFASQLINILQNRPVLSFLVASPISYSTTEYTNFVQSSASLKTHISGGVGICYSKLIAGEKATITEYGDLGNDIAQALIANPCFKPINDISSIKSAKAHLNRATALGLALHNTEVSSNTIFASKDIALPVNHIPMLGSIDTQTNSARVQQLIQLQLKMGGALYLSGQLDSLSQIKKFALMVQQHLIHANSNQLLVYLLQQDTAASFGNYLSDWRKLSLRILVIDNIPQRDAAFVYIGKASHNVHPVSFYGINAGD